MFPRRAVVAAGDPYLNSTVNHDVRRASIGPWKNLENFSESFAVRSQLPAAVNMPQAALLPPPCPVVW